MSDGANQRSSKINQYQVLSGNWELNVIPLQTPQLESTLETVFYIFLYWKKKNLIKNKNKATMKLLKQQPVIIA